MGTLSPGRRSQWGLVSGVIMGTLGGPRELQGWKKLRKARAEPAQENIIHSFIHSPTDLLPVNTGFKRLEAWQGPNLDTG